jgi:hypothetical protein
MDDDQAAAWSARRAVVLAVGGLVVNAVCLCAPSLATASSAHSNTVRQDTRLAAGQSRPSANRRFRLVMQHDGNLVLRRRGSKRALWSSQTAGHAGATAEMQGDGNLVVYSASRRPLYWTGTLGQAGNRLVVRNNGNLVMYSRTRVVQWSSRQDVHTLTEDQVLRSGQSRRSPNGRYRLVMQRDGNVVLHAKGSQQELWSSQSGGHAGATAELQEDGNLVVYSPSRSPLFWTATQGQAGNRLVVQNDGNVVVYSPARVALWSSAEDVHALTQDQVLRPGQSRSSSDRRFELRMQEDGNLALYEVSTNNLLWSSQTAGHAGATGEMQRDGNFVVYSVSRQPLFRTFTEGQAGNRLVVENDGHVVVYSAAGATLWRS